MGFPNPARLVTAFGGAVVRLFRGDFAAKLLRGFRLSAPYVRTAYEYAALASDMTGNRTFENVRRVADALGVPEVVADGEYTRDELGDLIARAIRMALAREYPDAQTRHLNRAIENAYGALNP